MTHAGFFGTGGSHFSNWLCGPGSFLPGPLGWIATLLFWGLIIYLGIWFFKTLADRNRTGSLEVLKERYARGEIDEEQYQRMKSTLE